MKSFAIAAVTLVALSSAAAAHGPGSGYGDRIDRRQANQEQSIRQGVRSGEITRHEYYKLEAEQARIRALERSAKRDGYVDPYERRRLEAAQDAARRHIAQEKHDGDRRHSHRGSWDRRWW
jgi:uncharacterized membrane protein YebE (DUF533 family)